MGAKRRLRRQAKGRKPSGETQDAEQAGEKATPGYLG